MEPNRTTIGALASDTPALALSRNETNREGEIHAKTPRRFPAWGWWLAAWIIAAIYVTAYASLIHRHTAVPYWDQTNYVSKSYYLYERWSQSPWIRRFSPWKYLGAFPQTRPPLMMALPAMLWGEHGTPHEMAYCWLTERMLFLMAGLWILSKVVRTARWVPAALCVILASHCFLNLDPALYMMDVPFTSLALLSVGLVAWAMQQRSLGSCIAACWGVVALLLVKPQGLAFMFPFMAVLLIERFVYEIRARRRLALPPSRHWLSRDFGLWLLMIAVMLLVIAGVFWGPYGHAVKLQYAWGQQGFWNVALSSALLRQILPGVMPPWLAAVMLGAALLLLLKKWRQPNILPPSPGPLPINVPGLVLLFLAGLVFWMAFSLLMTYAIDPRVLWAIMPICVSAAMIIIMPVRRLGILVTAAAGLLFILALPVATFGLPWREIPNPQLVLGPRIVQQHPVSETGEMALARKTERAVNTETVLLPRSSRVQVLVLFSEEYLECGGLILSARWENHDIWSRTAYMAFPFGSEGVDVAEQFDFPRSQWFLTQSGYTTAGSLAKALTDTWAVEALIVDPGSPIHGLFQKCGTAPIHKPLVAEPGAGMVATPDEYQWEMVHAEIWHLTRALTPEERRASIAYILPRYRGLAGEAAMKAKLAQFIAAPHNKTVR